MNIRIHSLAVTLACLSLVPTASGVVLVSNLSKTRTAAYGATFEQSVAAGFTTDSTPYELDSATLRIFASLGAVGDVAVSIYSDDGGLPDAVVPNGLLSGPTQPGAGDITYNSTGTISLAANSTYWLVLSIVNGDENRIVGWDWTSDNSPNSGPGTILSDGALFFGGSWSDSGTEQLFAVSATAVPEPATVAGIGALGLLGFAAVRQWRARHARQA